MARAAPLAVAVFRRRRVRPWQTALLGGGCDEGRRLSGIWQTLLAYDDGSGGSRHGRGRAHARGPVTRALQRYAGRALTERTGGRASRAPGNMAYQSDGRPPAARFISSRRRWRGPARCRPQNASARPATRAPFTSTA